MTEPAARAVVSDDGSTIWLTAYTAAGQAVPVALQPVRAVVLAGELIEAASEAQCEAKILPLRMR